MLKRGSSRSSRRGRPADSLSERDSGSRSRSPSPAAPRRKTRKSRSRDSSDDDKKERLKKAGRMKRAPLLDYSIVEAVYSAMVGQAQRRASRHWLQQFAKYEEAKRPGVIKADKFARCLSRMGIELDKREHYEALADCFKSSGGSGGDSDGSDNNKRKSTTQLVDYTAFVDFACNVRDSEKLSEIADSLRDSISKYDGKKQSSTSYNLAAGLEKMDRHKRGWITSTQFERALLREDQGPSFRLSASQVSTLVDRFEYEYEKQQLGIDYMQFAQWLQPLLHLDVEMVHERVKSLIKDAGEKEGWELEEIFRAMDDDKNGEIDAVELKEALLDMGLPLTDAQIRCLADEYDVDGDGKIQYSEFASLFARTTKKRTQIKKKKSGLSNGRSGDKSDTGSTTDMVAKKKNRPKRNVRNSFSWGITKAFARKQAAKSGSRKASVVKRTGKDVSSLEGDSSEAPGRKQSTRHGSGHVSTSSDEEIAVRRKPKRGRKSRSQLSDSSGVDKQASSSASDNQVSNATSRRMTTARKRGKSSSTESEKDGEQSKTAAKRKSSEKAAATRSEDEGKTRETSESEALKRSTKDRPDKSRREKVSREKSTTRDRRLDSGAVPRSRSRQKLSQRKSPRRRHRSRSYHGRRNASSQRKRHPSRSRSVRLHRVARNNAASSSDDGDNSNASDNNGSSSGLDVEQLRRRQRTKVHKVIRRGSYARSAYDDNTDEEHNGGVANELSNNEDCEGGEEWSRSDDEYHKHLKRSLKRAFDFFDLDQTSTIDKRELSHVLRALGHEFTSKELEAEMANADLDRNGQLDFYEFVAFVKKQLAEKTYLLSQQREMEIRQSFQSLDTDKNGALDEQEFEYLIYKVLQVELSVEEQDALLDFVDKDADGLISEDEFIVFMKKLETLHRKYSGKGGWRKQKQFLDSLDTTSQLAYSAMKKLVRGAPMDLDRNLLMFFGIPSNFRPAISSAATCRTLHGNTMEHVLSFPSPQTIEALALDTRLSDKKDSSWFALSRLDTNSDEYRMLQQAEGVEAQAIVSLKRAAGVPKPFDTREDDVVKRCVHVCLFQEQQEVSGSKGAVARRRRTAAAKNPKIAGAGSVVGNVHEIPVYWHQGEEDVWEFSKKSTKQDKYKFLVRTNAVNDHLYLLVEFIVHLKLTPEEDQSNKRSKRRTARKEQNDSGDELGADGGTREMVCCWCKIPVRQLLAKRSDILRRKEKLWGGTANAPVDIEQDELLRRRTGWRAFTNMFTKPSPPLMGIKSVPVDSLAEDLQLFVRKMPPIVIAPFVSLPILAEYMALVRKTLAHVTSSSSVMTCEPVLKLLPKIVDDHVALSIFRKEFDSEVAGMKPGEERQMKFQQLVLRMWPSFVHWQEHLPPSLLPQVKLPGAVQTSKAPAGVPPKGVTTTSNTAAIVNDQVAAQMRLNLLQTTASGKLRLQDVRVTSTPFHVREVAFRRLL